QRSQPDRAKGALCSAQGNPFWLKEPKNPWSDPRRRQAIKQAIKRPENIGKGLGGGAQHSNLIPAGICDLPLPESDLKGNYLKYDVEQAKSLLQAAGFGSGFEMELQSINPPRYITQSAEVVSEHLKAVGIKANVVPLEIGTFAKNNADGSYSGAQLP